MFKKKQETVPHRPHISGKLWEVQLIYYAEKTQKEGSENPEMFKQSFSQQENLEEATEKVNTQIAKRAEPKIMWR